MKLPILIILVAFAPHFTHAQQVFLPIGSLANAQAGNSVTQSNAFSLQNNPAAITQLHLFAVGIDSKLPFLQTNLSTNNISLVKPFKYLITGLAITQFGYAKFNQQRVSVAMAKKVSNMLSLGVNFTYLATNIYEQPNLWNIIGEMGFLFEPNKKLKFGLFVFNPTQNKYLNTFGDKIPSFIRAGISYEVAKDLNLNTEYEQYLGFKNNIKASIQYQLNPVIGLMCGWASYPANMGFGSTINYKKTQFVFAANVHQTLGLTPGFSLIYKGN